MGTVINVVAYHSEREKEGTTFLPGGGVQGVTQDEILAQFDGWEDEVLDLFRVCLIAHSQLARTVIFW